MRIGDLKAAPYNPRKIDGDARKALAASIERFGLVQELVVNRRSGFVVGGHQRLDVLRERGVTEVPVVWVDLPDAEEKALNVALNSRHLAGDWSDDLPALLDEIGAALPELAVDLRLDDLRDDLPPLDVGGADDDDEPPVLPDAVSVRGEVYECGPHRVMCGDSTSSEDVARLLGERRAGLMNTDPPYGVAYTNTDRPGVAKSSATPKVENDELEGVVLQAFLERAFHAAIVGALRLDAAWYLWHAHLTQGFFAAAAAAAANVVLSRQIIWVKPTMLLTRGQYHWKHEPCFFGWVTGHQPKDNGRGQGERDQTTVWEVGSVGRADREEFNHSTPKPVGLFEIPVVKHLDHGEWCYDPFAGTGPQVIAAAIHGRRCAAMDIEPRYVDVIRRRWTKWAREHGQDPGPGALEPAG